ncbi:hypothetical protein BS47DRAFT_1367488 [Hydnum rufescens UP504]|uniref:Uncharacterized protein n=1 Tax=Hydnum rufescens UP504 TaxID=1448309 RepID=A0A9P6DLW9_9AGAM|nr:hypothetical protein BS47DRAFT_1367488 [Hydnum rufescens UP504]
MAIIRRQCMMKEEVTVPHTHCGFLSKVPHIPHENPYKLAPNPMLKHLSTTTQNTHEELKVPHTRCGRSPLCENPPNVNMDNAPHENTETHSCRRPTTNPTMAKHSTTHPLRRVCGNTCCPLDAQNPTTRTHQGPRRNTDAHSHPQPDTNTPTELQTKHEPMWTPALQYKMEVFSFCETPSEEYTNKAWAKCACRHSHASPQCSTIHHQYNHASNMMRYIHCAISDPTNAQTRFRKDRSARPPIPPTLDFPNVYEDATPAEAAGAGAALLALASVPPLCDTPPNDMIREPSPQHLQHTQQWTPHTRSGGCVVISGKMAPKEQQELLFWSPLPQMKPDPTRTRTEPQHGIWTCAVAEDLA